jgi:hypothetical protein
MIREILAIVILTLASPCAWAQIGPDQTPPVDDAGKTYFRERFLVSGFNRAFAISPSGKWAGWLGSTSERAREQAIAACEKKASQPCSLYAFDGYVLAGQDFSTIPRYADAPTLGLFIPSDYTPVLGPERAKGVIIWMPRWVRLRATSAGSTPPAGTCTATTANISTRCPRKSRR